MNFIKFDGKCYSFTFLDSDSQMDLTTKEKILYNRQLELWKQEAGETLEMLLDMAECEFYRMEKTPS